jgi:hypothetical protein
LPAVAAQIYARCGGKAKVEWKVNGLRHSFITYRLAASKDVAALALEADSPTMIFRHYRELAEQGWKTP